MTKENSNINNLLESAQKAIQLKKFNDARDIFKKIININNTIPEVYNNLGLVYLNLQNYGQAIESFNCAIELKPEFSVAFCNLGIAYRKNENFKLAEQNYKKSIFLDKGNLLAYYNLANLYKDQNDLSNAEKYYDLVLSLKPNMIHAYRNLFFIYNRSNQFEKLKEILDKARSNLEEQSIIDFFQGIYDFENNDFKAVIKNFQNLKIDKNEIEIIMMKNELLAKSYDKICDYNQSFECFVEANDFIYRTYKNTYKKENYINLIKNRIHFFSKFDKKKWESKFSPERDPIYLIGFPRSGTTLLDTILRTHKDIEVIEEKPIVIEFIDDLKNKMNRDFSNLENIDKNFYKQMRNIYFEKRNKYIEFNKKNFYVDKLPLNLIFIGEIYRFFPNAKFIFALRNPYDVVLSCFMQQFAPNDAMMNFNNIGDTSKFYDLSMTLYKIYKRLFGSNLYEIKYEDVVNDFDNSIKGLLKFLNIEWQEEIRKFHKTAKKRGIISTPSYNQVSKPIYKESINRWRNYEKKFKTVKPILNKWLDEFSY